MRALAMVLALVASCVIPAAVEAQADLSERVNLSDLGHPECGNRTTSRAAVEHRGGGQNVEDAVALCPGHERLALATARAWWVLPGLDAGGMLLASLGVAIVFGAFTARQVARGGGSET